MKILHTADWHLGVSLGAEKRFKEFDLLLDHICSIIKTEQIDAVIIAGDVFDSHMPPNHAAEQYYNFLVKANQAGAKKIIVVGGNHDSAAYLEAPKLVLKHLSIHVFANASKDCKDMIIPLTDQNGKTVALIGAVPYLHERDLVIVEGGQTVLERENALRNAMLDYYKKMADALNETNPDVPHIVTGHLFATDCNLKNDSWTGTLMSVSADDFPASFDYLALGHLHDSQTLKTANSTCIRYAGAPVNVSFRELEVAKSVTVIDTDDVKNFREITLPSFQDMRVLRGNRTELEAELEALKKLDRSVWCSIENTGSYEPGLAEILNSTIKDSNIRIITCRNAQTNPAVLERLPSEQHLSELKPLEVFKMMLKKHPIADELSDRLFAAFNEIETAAREDEF